jgi:hypothetical protein
VHDDAAIERAAAALRGDAAEILDRPRRHAMMGDLRIQVGLAFTIHHE